MKNPQRILSLLTKITDRSAKVGIIGMGYVGSALAEAVVKAKFTTIGFDIDKKKINSINSLNQKKLSATVNSSKIKECHIICICIPTPITKSKKPDLSILKRVLTNVSKYLQKSQLIIVESSVAPGITRNLVLPALEKSKMRVGADFFLAFSPERIDPGNQKFNIHNTPKIVSGFDKKSLQLASAFYKKFVQKVISVSSPETAEMTKVLENTFRLVNISLINEMATFSKKLDIDIWEVIEAAKTKPYGFLAHYPGPGAGGDCIPVLPYHLLDSASKRNIPLMVVAASVRVNELQPQKVAEKAIEIVNGKLKNTKTPPKILLVGISYKPETADIRQSPALRIWQLLEENGMSVQYHDPYVKNINGSFSQKLTLKNISDCDVVIITTPHKKVPYKKFLKNGTPVIDTQDILRNFDQPNIFRL